MSERARYRLSCVLWTLLAGVVFMLSGVVPELIASG